ncbi:MAG: TatD family hydrolase [Patescibacteria group bacterium]|nr:TatD family hydrolase [Patescibacteria group bacterium]
MHYFDAHTHAHFSAFIDDSKEVIDRALATGVWLINVGTQKDTSRRAVEIANEYEEGIYAAVGIHPVHTSKSHHDEDELGGGEAAKAFTSRGEEFDHDYYGELARDPKVVAIGECGLDYYRLEEGSREEGIREKQKEVFIRHIKLSQEIKKPLMIHCRSAFSDLIKTLSSHSLLSSPGVVHFFSGTLDDAKHLLDMGFSFTFGGAITFPPRKNEKVSAYDAIVRMLPLDKILSETDAPYVAPVPYRGKRNEPMYVVEVVKKLAELKGVSVEEMAKVTFENARKVFKV